MRVIGGALFSIKKFRPGFTPKRGGGGRFGRSGGGAPDPPFGGGPDAGINGPPRATPRSDPVFGVFLWYFLYFFM